MTTSTLLTPDRAVLGPSIAQATHLALLAFEELAGLENLATNLSFLSYNAGFAGFRAGEDGRTVSVLTQFTRRASEELLHAHDEIQDLRSKTYRKNAELLLLQGKESSLISCIDLLSGTKRAIDSDRDDEQGRAVYTQVCKEALGRFRGEIERGFQAVFGYLDALMSLTQDLGDVLMRMENIATRVAIEATGIRDQETDFVQVAERMRGDCEALRSMLLRTKRAIRRAKNGSSSRIKE
ncbi:MAG TPA: hypothetical protein ENK02_14345 [Planctomycetes bacterium]|nr:hypothetical protein [Planctomycetota bacterium]